MHILIVEDEVRLADALGHILEEEKYQTDVVYDGQDGLDYALSGIYDLIILDVMLPGPNGFEVCKALRRKSRCPIVFLTALGNEDNILKGYEIGADEYMVKPFSPKVLYAKCLALLSRTEAELTREDVIECSGIRLYPLRMEVVAGGQEVALSPKEYFLLKALMENKGIVLDRDRLLDLVWGVGFDGTDRVVDSQIKKLRKSLGNYGGSIKTVIGGGYKIV